MRAVERGGCKKGEIPMGRLFGTDGIRGIANKDLTCELATQLGREVEMRFDVAEVIWQGGKFWFRCIEDAFSC